MAKPYSTTAQVLNPALLSLVTTARWNRTELTGDVAALIQEGDNEIDARLAGLEVALPFVANPPLIQDLSVLYARYACFRDLYAAGNPNGKAGSSNEQKYLDMFNAKFKSLVDGYSNLVTSAGVEVASLKFATLTIDYPSATTQSDQYPNFPSGPYPDPPVIGD